MTFDEIRFSNFTVRKTPLGTKLLIMICEDQAQADFLHTELSKGKFSVTTGLTVRRTYKVGISINGIVNGIEIYSEDSNLKWLLEGNVKNITVAYFLPDKRLFLYSRHFPILSGSMN